MNETAFDSIARSFFRSLFKKARENARAKVNRIFHHLHHPTWKTSSIGISLSPRARLKENDTHEKHEKNKNNATTTHRTLTLLLETTFKRTDCATADWVTENIICVWVFKWCQFMARYLCFFFCLFGGNLLGSAVWCVRFHAEREYVYFREQRLFLEAFLLLFFHFRRCTFFSQ